jgi:hypothetical protein
MWEILIAPAPTGLKHAYAVTLLNRPQRRYASAEAGANHNHIVVKAVTRHLWIPRAYDEVKELPVAEFSHRPGAA